MPKELDDWIEAYRVAWVNRDPRAASDLFTSDATYRDSIFESAHAGTRGVFEYWSGVTENQSDVRVRMGRPFVDGSRVAVEFWTNMTSDGEPVTLGGCLLLDFDEDWSCERLREYWFFQGGAREPPPEWGE